MTNGEKIKEVFPNSKIITQYDNPFGDRFIVFTLNDEDMQVNIEWWNAEYKEPTKIVEELSSSEKPNMSEIPTGSAAKYEAKVLTRGNCMKCGKKLAEGLFFCKECEAEVAKAVITLLEECGNDETEIITAESENEK